MNKIALYQILLPQIESLVAGETDTIANMANVAAALHEAFGFWWTGFYRVEGQQLVLGPFQGPIACTRIPMEKESVARLGNAPKPSLSPTSIISPDTSHVHQPPIAKSSSISSVTTKLSPSSTSTARISTPLMTPTNSIWNRSQRCYNCANHPTRQNRTSSAAPVSAGECTTIDAWQFPTTPRALVYGFLLPKPAELHVANRGTSLLWK